MPSGRGHAVALSRRTPDDAALTRLRLRPSSRRERRRKRALIECSALCGNRAGLNDRHTRPRFPDRPRRRHGLLGLRAVTDRGRVLVVDDERVVRDMLREIFEHLGHDVSTAASGQLAIAAMATIQPHVVMLDMQMPGMTGLEVLAHLRQHSPRRSGDSYDGPRE
jgi:hypothetical protein